jgi:hypothetical protein
MGKIYSTYLSGKQYKFTYLLKGLKMKKETRMYVGCKIISARPSTAEDGREGYVVEYPNPNGVLYSSWSPKEVFETCYRPITEAEKDFWWYLNVKMK